MLNLRYILRLVIAFVTRFKVLIGLSVVFGVIAFFLIRLLFPIFVGGYIQRIGITGRFTPSNLPNFIIEKIGNGLTKLDSSGNVEPDIASSWETPDRGKTWVFKIKENLFWQDEKKVTSQTLNYKFSDVTIEKPDDQTIVFKLENPYSAFPSVVSKPVFKTGLLGTGNWRVKKLDLKGKYIDKITIENAKKEKIVYKFYPTEERSILAFKLGEVDVLADILNPEELLSWNKVKVTKNIDYGKYVALFFNTEDPFLSDKNIRQALGYAINKSVLGDKRALSPVSIVSWAYNPQVKPYNYDPAKAKEIINDYKKSSNNESIELNLNVAPILLNQAESVVHDWNSIGLKVNLKVVPNIPTDYQALIAIFDVPSDPDQYSIWHSTQVSTNITHYNNPRIDKLLEDGRSEIDLETRKKIYLDFQRFLVEDSPAVFLYYPTTYTISRY